MVIDSAFECPLRCGGSLARVLLFPQTHQAFDMRDRPSFAKHRKLHDLSDSLLENFYRLNSGETVFWG